MYKVQWYEKGIEYFKEFKVFEQAQKFCDDLYYNYLIVGDVIEV
jgi:hypothetical protein